MSEAWPPVDYLDYVRDVCGRDPFYKGKAASYHDWKERKLGLNPEYFEKLES